MTTPTSPLDDAAVAAIRERLEEASRRLEKALGATNLLDASLDASAFEAWAEAYAIPDQRALLADRERLAGALLQVRDALLDFAEAEDNEWTEHRWELVKRNLRVAGNVARRALGGDT